MTKAQCDLVTDKDVVNYIKSMATRMGNKYRSVGSDEFYSIGIAAACEQAMRYNPKRDVQFSTYITVYVNGAMARFVQKYVEGMYLDKQERFFASIISIEEMGIANDDDDTCNGENMLSANMIDDDDREDRIKERIDAILEKLSPDEREVITARYGFTDNNGEAVEEYIRKHNIRRSTFYGKANAVELKMMKLAKNLKY